MDNQEFKKEALRTEPTVEQYYQACERLRNHGIGVALIRTLHIIKQQLENLDDLKKYLFYGKDTTYVNNFLSISLPILERDFPSIAKDNSERGKYLGSSLGRTRVLHGVIGMATECGELIEALLKTVDGKLIDKINVMEEIGDSNWYQALLSDVLCFDVDDANSRVIAKLRERFPEKFTNHDAVNRDLIEERRVLEQKV